MAKKKDKKWIQKASASIKKRGTEGVCTGDKFGGSTCPPGSKRYNLAKVFKGMAKKRKKAAEGAMIHAKDSKYIKVKSAEQLAIDAAKTRISKAAQHREVLNPTRKKATGAMIHARHSKYVKGTASTKDLLKHINKIVSVLPIAARDWKKKPATKATGAMIHAQHGVHAQVRSSLAAKGMKAATAGTAYKSPGWINKNLSKLKDFMKAGTKTTSMKGSITPSKWLSKIPKGSQLKTLTKVGGRRSLMLMGGPMGAAAAAATLTPGIIDKLTKRAPGAKKTKLFGIDIKGAEKSARAREALMAKRNKARNAQTGTMVRAAHGEEVLGKQQVPFKVEPASANLAEQRQGRKGAAVRGFDFKGVR